MKKNLMALALSLGLASTLAAQDPFWSVTLDGLYAKPFRSEGYFGSKTDGFGLNAAFEYRSQPWLGIGLNIHSLGLRMTSDASAFSGADLFARIQPMNSPHFEPYAVLGVGADYAASAEATKQMRDPGAVLTAGIGTLVPFGGSWAFDIGADYVSRPSGSTLQNVQARVGLQLRMGSMSSYRAEAPMQSIELQSSQQSGQSLGQGAKGGMNASASRSKSEFSSQGGRSYVVQPGDSLWRIAAKSEVYGKGSEYTKLVEANKATIKDADLIYPKTPVILP